MGQATIPLPGAVPITATSATQQKVLLPQRVRHLQRVHLATNIQVLRENILHPAPQTIITLAHQRHPLIQKNHTLPKAKI